MTTVLTPELMEKIKFLSKKDRKEAYRRVGKIEFEHCADDVFYWLDHKQHVKTPRWPEGLPYVFTKDPHILYHCAICSATVYGTKRELHLKLVHEIEGKNAKEVQEFFYELPPIRPFTVIEYMPPIIEYWLRNQFMAVEKSRDMMATWLMVTLHTWDVMFHKGRQHIFQSEDSLKSAELVQRAKVLFDYQPEFLKVQHPAKYGQGSNRSGVFTVPSLESEILGFPQGADQIRQFHPSGLFQDEAAFQIEAANAFAAIKPAVQAGGRFTAISSANPSWFMTICRDTSDQ
jgi:hypothetical protein